MMWIAAQLLPRRETLALHCLALAGYATYLPRIRASRIMRGRKIDATPALFPGYAFIVIESQWRAARWSPGVAALIMDGDHPARVADKIVAEIQAREIDGLIELPPPPKFKPGDRVKVKAGPLSGLAGLYSGQAPQDRILILLTLLGASRQIALPAGDVVAVR